MIRELALLAAALVASGCMQTAMRGETSPSPSRGPAREWRIGGVFDAAHVVNPAARPLAAKLRVGEVRDLWCLPVDDHHGREPRMRWVSSRPDVASVSSAGGPSGATLRGISEGEAVISALVGVHGGVRAELFYYCCGACTESALPRCEPIRIDRVVVVP